MSSDLNSPGGAFEEDTGERPGDGLGEFVGASDADADVARAGGDVDLTDAVRDTESTPVGYADAVADAERAGGDRGQLTSDPDHTRAEPGVQADELR